MHTRLHNNFVKFYVTPLTNAGKKGIVVRSKRIAFFSYSEWWRYIGPMKPRQPRKTEGANLSERIEQ